MNLILATQVIIGATVCLLILYDIYAALKGGVVATISFQIDQWSKRYRIIPFLFGALMAHFFWPVTG